MKLVLFDLGRTLEADDVLRPGALDTLRAIADLRVGGAQAALLGLLSDFHMPADPEQLPGIQQDYYATLDALGIRGFFEPVARRVTLSSEVGARKPAAAMFRAAVARAEPSMTFGDVLFVTENAEHVRAARELGLRAVHISPPGTVEGEIAELPELLPIVAAFTGAPDTAGAAAARTTLGDAAVVTGAAERLHLVTQNGDLFHREHPDVPVVVDRGRLLVVDVDPGDVTRLHYADGTCWSIRPLPPGAEVLSRVETAARAEDAAVRRCVDALSATGFRADLAALVAHGSRHSTGSGFAAAMVWAGEQLTAAGYVVATHEIPVGGATSRNLVAERRGTGPDPRDVVVVTAHLDSVNLRGGPAAAAPGADDNASGSAGVLAIARALGGAESLLDLRFVLFGGEEQGLLGSTRYVRRLPADERGRIRAVVNMDMIGSRNTSAPEVLLEGAAVSATLIEDLATAAATYTGLSVTRSLSPFNSDHVPFIDVGIPAVLTIEGGDSANTAIHSEADVLDTVDTDLAVDILRMNTAFVADLLRAG